MGTDGNVRRQLRTRRAGRAMLAGREPATVRVLSVNSRRLVPTATKNAPPTVERFSAVVGASWSLSGSPKVFKTAAFSLTRPPLREASRGWPRKVSAEYQLRARLQTSSMTNCPLLPERAQAAQRASLLAASSAATL